MELGMVGLGRMGGNMAQRLLNGGHQVVTYDPIPQAVEATVREGAIGASSLADLVDKLAPPRVVWLMVSSGDPTESTINNLMAELAPGDIIIDGGNSNYKDSIRRAKASSEKGQADVKLVIDHLRREIEKVLNEELQAGSNIVKTLVFNVFL